MKYLVSIKYFFFSCFILILAGCVATKHLIGERIQEDLSKQFDGIWVEAERSDKDDGRYVKFITNGELRVAYLGWNKDDDKFLVEEFTIFLTKCGHEDFINIPLNSIGVRGDVLDDAQFNYFAYYFFASENELTVCAPITAAFEKAITRGDIKGYINDEQDYVITESEKSLCDFIKISNIEELFDLDTPHNYIKSSRRLSIYHNKSDTVHNVIPSE